MTKFKKIDNMKILFFSLLIMLVGFSYYMFNAFNHDTWFLFNHGRYVLEHGIPTIEPFTMHENFSFVMQQWLSSVIFYFINLKFGSLGFSLFITVIFFVTLLLIYKTCLLVSDKNYNLAYLIIIICAIILPYFFTGRPQIFSYIMYILLLYFLESYVKTKNYKYLIGLPIISLLEINLHGSMWWLLFCFTLPYIIESLYCYIKKKETYPLKPLLIFAGLMLLMGFVNPYGIDMMLYLFKSYGVYEINHYVFEMNVLDITKNFGKVAYFTLFIVLFFFSKSKYKTVRHAILLLGITYLVISAWRNYQLFVIIASIILAFSGKDVLKNKNFGISLKQTLIFILSFFVTFGSILLVTKPSPIDYSYLEDVTNYLLKQEDYDKFKIYTMQEYGGYLEYAGLRPYIDTRSEVFLKSNNHKKDVFKEFYRLQNGYLLPSEFLQRYNFTHLVVQKDDILYRELKQNKDYKLVYQNDKYYIYVPVD